MHRCIDHVKIIYTEHVAPNPLKERERGGERMEDYFVDWPRLMHSATLPNKRVAGEAIFYFNISTFFPIFSNSTNYFAKFYSSDGNAFVFMRFASPAL
ncbi:hypothetical protein FKM82_013145 [Ascaphus truei]